eukprot:5461263-Amphidinium_carterae.1
MLTDSATVVWFLGGHYCTCPRDMLRSYCLYTHYSKSCKLLGRQELPAPSVQHVIYFYEEAIGRIENTIKSPDYGPDQLQAYQHFT